MVQQSVLPTAFRPVPRTGVIFVTTEAQKRGFRAGHPDWSNLGQGQPQGGPLPGSPPRVQAIQLESADDEYAPVAGLWSLREAVADMYNRLYRRGKKSQYSAENVAISSGGRTALTRAAAAIGEIHLGHFIPDYTAYEELLDVFRLFWPTPIPLEPDRGYAFSADDLRREIVARGLGGVLLSNPSNPTGKLIAGDTLDAWVHVARKLDCTLLVDEFYSHYVWTAEGPVVSAAEYVEDVDRDPVVIFDGLTKNWRYAGWRIAWTVGPRSVIEAITSAGSFLDGGAPHPLQRAAVNLLDAEHMRQETDAIRRTFLRKRQLVLDRLQSMGMWLDAPPAGTFYAWVKLDQLPPPLNTGMGFFTEALEEKVICVPGEFFDVNPGKRRAHLPSRFHAYARISYGPAEAEVVRGLDRLEAMITRVRAAA
jgi:hypothetical protein